MFAIVDLWRLKRETVNVAFHTRVYRQKIHIKVYDWTKFFLPTKTWMFIFVVGGFRMFIQIIYAIVIERSITWITFLCMNVNSIWYHTAGITRPLTLMWRRKIEWLPVLSCCKQRRNFISQSQWLRVKGWWLQRPRLHSPADNVCGQRSCSLQQRSSSAYLPTSLYSVAIEPLVDRNNEKKKNHI